MESQSGHHPGHHGHPAHPHNSTLPHHVHVGGTAAHHQIHLDNHSHHPQHSSSHHQSHSKHKSHEPGVTHKTHHHNHHHVSTKSIYRNFGFDVDSNKGGKSEWKNGKITKCDCAKSRNEIIGKSSVAFVIESDL